ncbi:MAG: trigger factor [Patescibacteria group bacterium]|nr:trigger factor [Patescibacteria group bacterium]
MEFKVKHLKNAKVEAIIETSKDEFAKLQQKAIERISKDVKIPGFRKGKVPVNMIRDKIDDHMILSEIIDTELQKWYENICIENKLRPISDVKPEILSPSPLKIRLEFTVWPEVELIDPKKLKAKKIEAKISDKDIEKRLGELQEQFIEWVETDKPAKQGDKVEVDFDGFDEENKPLPSAKSQKHPLVIGSDMMIPGFEKELINLKKDSEKEFKITFPKDYHSESMRNKKATFKVKIHHVFTKKLPEINDQLAEKISQGQFKKLADFTAKLKELMQKDGERLAQGQYEEALIAEFAEKAKLEIPDVLVEEALTSMLENFKHDLKRDAGLKFEQYLEHMKITEDDIKKKWRDAAIKRVREELVLLAYAAQEKLGPNDKEINKEIEDILNGIQDKEERKKALNYYSKPNERQHLEITLIIRSAIEKIAATSWVK